MGYECRTKDRITQLADEHIRSLKIKAYGRECSNELEGDCGTWDDWRDALIEFALSVIKDREITAIQVAPGELVEVTTHSDGPDNRKFIPYIREKQSRYDLRVQNTSRLNQHSW